jgi:hypothetical protein
MDDIQLSYVLGWLLYWSLFGVVLSIVSTFVFRSSLRWETPKTIGWFFAATFGSLISTILAVATVLYLGYNIGVQGSYLIGGALCGLILGTIQWLFLRRHSPYAAWIILIGIGSWAIGWSTWYLPVSFELAIVIGLIIVTIIESFAFYRLFLKQASSFRAEVPTAEKNMTNPKEK